MGWGLSLGLYFTLLAVNLWRNEKNSFAGTLGAWPAPVVVVDGG